MAMADLHGYSAVACRPAVCEIAEVHDEPANANRRKLLAGGIDGGCHGCKPARGTSDVRAASCPCFSLPRRTAGKSAEVPASSAIEGMLEKVRHKSMHLQNMQTKIYNY